MKKREIKEIDIEYMTDTSAAMLTGAPIKFHFILWAAVAFLFLALVWANYSVLDEVTVGQGSVIPSRNIQVVQNLEGGIIKDIRVSIGDVVERDQVLMIIDDTRFSSSFKENETQVYALQAKIARLQAEAYGKELDFPDKLVKLFPQYVESESNFYNSKQSELRVKLNILSDQESQRLQELKEAQGRKAQIKRSFDLVQREYVLTKPLVSEGAVSEVDLIRLERQVNDLAGELESTETQIPRLESQLKSAQRKIDETNITFKTEAINELNQAKSEINRLDETLKAAKDRVARTTVRSPVRGTINQVRVSTIGAVVQPGEDLIDIVPLEDSLLIEANIRPSDIGFLKPNQAATVKITAYDFSIYGGLEATVEHISADTITDERGDAFYQIRVRTNEDSVLHSKKGEPLAIIPGMPATVDILTGHKTVLDYLLKPILKAKKTALRER